MTIKTSCGFEYEADIEKVLDYEFSYLIGCFQTDAPEEKIVDEKLLLDKLLGSKSEVLRFFKYIKETNDGKIESELVTDFIKESMELMKFDKKK